MGELFVLFEHAAGYGLFVVKEFEEIGTLLPQVEKSVTELKRFNQIVGLVSFSPFKTAVVALENINNISEGLMTESLQLFLEANLPKKKKKYTLGVGDSKLAAAITDTLGLQCLCTGPIPEIIRGIRVHFHSMVKGFTSKTSGIAQLGLGHSYSRAKVKFNVNRVDNMIIQSISLLDQLDKDINTFAMRIREWYSYHFPELYKITPENYMYAKLAKAIGNRKLLTEDSVDMLEEITMDRQKAEDILEASKSSIGMDIAEIDLLNIELFATRVISLSNYRQDLATYLNKKMSAVAPNLATLIGDQVGARLISQAGSLTNLAKFPASTVQILGAEKALFRALKTRSATPKYGLIYNSSFIGRAEAKNKGRISRYLANKCSMASRIDCFSETSSTIFGRFLKEQVEERLRYFKTGDVVRKNVDVMREAIAETAEEKKLKKKQKKAKKRKTMEMEEAPAEENGIAEGADANGFNETQEETEEPVKKKKKKKKSKVQDED